MGSNRETHENSSASGSVGSVVPRNLTGGFVGFQSSTGSIINSFASGSVQGLDDTGGLIGRNDVTVNYSFATGAVSSTGTNIGGFVGEQNGGLITASYSRGSVTGGTNAGGFIGAQTSGTITDSVWDTDAAGSSGEGTGTVTGISGKTSSQLQDISTYTALGWDIVEGWSSSADWGICSAVNNGYPFPTGLYTSNPCESGSSTSSGPPARFQFTFWLPDGRECTSIGPVTVVDGTQFTLPGVDAECRTMPGATFTASRTRVANFLHGPIQAELLTGSVSGESPDELAARVYERFEDYGKDTGAESSSATTETIVSTWSMVLNVTSDISPQARAMLDSDATVAETTAQALSEAFANVLRHANSTNVEVLIEVLDHHLNLTVTSEGVASAISRGGIGLQSLRQGTSVVELTSDETRTRLFVRV